MELSDLQRLAVAEAMGKAIRGMTDPRGGAHGAPTLRTECDDALRAARTAAASSSTARRSARSARASPSRRAGRGW